MARTRALKPRFFLNEELGRVDPLARLLFEGLWCVADRRGRLEDRPTRIKAEVLPYDDCDVDALLSSLAETGVVLRYAVNSERYIQVVNFERHQNPHPREPESVIPAPAVERSGLGNAKALPGPAVNPLPVLPITDVPETHIQAADAAVPAPAPEPEPKSKSDVDYPREVFEEYRVRIQPKANFLDDARRKIQTRLRTWTAEQLKAAIAHFAADTWQMEHNAHRGAAWFFASDSRIEQYVNLEPKEVKRGAAAERARADRPASGLAKYATGPRPQPG